MRAAAFFAIFAFFWVTTTPFIDLRNPDVLLATNDGNALQQVCSLALLCLAFVILAKNRHMVAIEVSPALICVLAWQFLTVLTSGAPDLSLRRYIASVVTLVIAMAWPIVARDEEHFSRLLTIGLVGVLALAYFGIEFMPGVSIHNLDEVLELVNAGGWRGHFAHKNIAGAAMVFVLIYALYLRHRERRIVVGLILGAAAVFLYKSDNKTSIGLVATVLFLSAIVHRTRSLPLKAALVLIPVGLLELFTVGSVVFPPIHAMLADVSSDPSYTGRADVWHFGIDMLANRAVFGYGFDAFWATPALVDGGYGIEGWAATAGHAHNGALNIAMSTGVPGMLLVLYFVMWQPLVDYHRAQVSGNGSDLSLMHLRVWIFALFYSCLESPFFVTRGPIWFTILGAIFGLRCQARAALVAAPVGRLRAPSPSMSEPLEDRA